MIAIGMITIGMITHKYGKAPTIPLGIKYL